MRRLHPIGSLLLAVLLYSCIPTVVYGQSDGQLPAIREAYRAGSQPETAVVESIIRQADAELSGPVYTIVHKEVLPPSGVANDYMTIGPYWWPDPDKEDGLPWVRRDGEVNPVTQGELADRVVASKFVRAIEALAYAAYFTGQARYAARAEVLMRAWFVDPSTRMNPHLDYAQGVPGRSEGRCFGIIEWMMIDDLVQTQELLGAGEIVDPEVLAAADAWIEDYLGWLLTSRLGIEEGERHNNHGTWYDVQLMSMLLHFDRREEARKIATEVRRRIDSQIRKDGAQPHELERTKSLSYSTMNLRAFTRLAELAREVGVDLWGYTSPGGGSIPAAFAFLRPYVEGEREWVLPQLSDPVEVLASARKLFRRAGSQFAVTDYCAFGNDEGEQKQLEDLLYPCPKD